MKKETKVYLNDKEKEIIKTALYLRGESYRSWLKSHGLASKSGSIGLLTNYISPSSHTAISKEIYETYFKDLHIPFLDAIKWEEEINTTHYIDR